MSQQTTIRKLAELVNTPVEKLLEQLAEAGMSFSGPDQVVTSTEKMKLLGFLRRTHGKAEKPAEDAAAPKKITLNAPQGAGTDGRLPASTKSTVDVEVRQKRTYVKPTARPTSPAPSAAAQRPSAPRSCASSRNRASAT